MSPSDPENDPLEALELIEMSSAEKPKTASENSNEKVMSPVAIPEMLSEMERVGEVVSEGGE